MDRAEILLPIVALAALTFMVLSVLGVFRILGIASGRYAKAYYSFFDQADNGEPRFVRLVARNYHNLLELPILFYAGCLMAYAAELVSQSLVSIAWLYVALRVVHTVVHVTYNRVWHRITIFVVGTLVLMVFWLALAQALLLSRA